MLALSHIEIAACKDGQLKYSLIFAGKEIDRFILPSKDKYPKRRAGWISHALALGNQPSAEIVIPPIDIPALEYNTFEKLERAEAEIDTLKTQLHSACDTLDAYATRHVKQADEYCKNGCGQFSHHPPFGDPCPNEKPTNIIVQPATFKGPIADVMSAVDDAFANVKHPLP